MSQDLTTQDDLQPPKSDAQKQRERMDALIKAVEGRSEQLSTLLKESGISFKLFIEMFRRAIIKGQEKPATNLLLADAGSVIQACIDACTAGVLPDGKRGAIVLYNTNVAGRGEPKRYVKRAQFLVMYEGMLQIAYESGNFTSIMAHVVYETDEWDYALGIDPWIEHKPGSRPVRPEGAPPYAVIAAYAVAKTTNGGVFVEVFEPEDIRKVMAVSRATSGPAKDWPEQLARKGPLRRMWKFLPRDARMDRVVDVDDENFDLKALAPEPAIEHKLTPGFRPAAAPAAIEQGVDLAMDVGMDIEAPDELEAVAEVQPKEHAQQGATAEPENPMAIFHAAVEAAKAWPAIKKALDTFAKEQGADTVYSAACTAAWERFREVGDKTDFVTDPLLFECWIHGSEADADSVEANWRIVRGTEAFSKASDMVQTRISDLVAEVTGEETSDAG